MLIRLGYDIELDLDSPRTIVAMLSVHSSRTADLLEPDEMSTSPGVIRDEYMDSFGNRCTRLQAPAGILRMSSSTVIADSGEPDAVDWRAQEVPVAQLPPDILQFLLPSRYCEVDQLSGLAWSLFGNVAPGWGRVHAICSWVNSQVTFGYQFARNTRTAVEVSQELCGVCRDFQHLAVSLCRAMHIPARYATGYLGDIGIPAVPGPMDFSAWFEAYLDGRWWTFDARHNKPRMGRVLIATGRDAADVAITTSFGPAWLRKFDIVSDEITASTMSQQSQIAA